MDCTGDIETRQREYYNEIASAYHLHHNDPWAFEYQKRFINPPLVEGIELNGARVLDAMCGTGSFTQYLLETGADITGIDVSDHCIQIYNSQFASHDRPPKGIRASIFDTGFESESFDLVTVVGGLHHIQPDVEGAVAEIHRILKSGGVFSFMEPHSGSLPDYFRRRVYRTSSELFEENEEAIDLDALIQSQRSRFELERIVFRGNLAYLLIQNSLASGFPPSLKPKLGPLLFGLERAATALFTLSPFVGKRLGCYMCGQFRKLPAS